MQINRNHNHLIIVAGMEGRLTRQSMEKTKVSTLQGIPVYFCLLALVAISVAPINAETAVHSNKSLLISEEGSLVSSTTLLARMPLLFEANQGQCASSASFIARAGQSIIHLGQQQTAVQLPDTTVSIRFIGANASTTWEGQKPIAARRHYFHGANSSSKSLSVPLFQQVSCASLYPGIDLVFYGNQGHIEYDFRVQPGANPERIMLAFDGADDMQLDAEGNLLIQAGSNQVKQFRPLVHQQIGIAKHEIKARFRLLPGHQAQVELGEYDATQPLVIDPVLSCSTFFGGRGDDQAIGIATDPSGNVYIAGQTTSPDFPAIHSLRKGASATYDVFIAKFDPSCSALVYSTILGGSGNDRGYSLAVDTNGCALVAGVTYSTNFPTANAFQPLFGGGDRDGFVAKLTANGAKLIYSTYLGGNGSEDIATMAFDLTGNVFVAGQSSSTNYPIRRAIQSSNRGGFDAVVTQLTPGGQVDFSTYLGGTGPYESAIGITIDAQGKAIVTGYTCSTDWPATQAMQPILRGGYDAFIAKLDISHSSLVFSTYFGGNNDDVGRSIVVDAGNNIYVCGDTVSTNFPVVNPMQKNNAGKRDIFIAKMNDMGSELHYSTYLGGSGEELASIAVDAAGCVCLAGLTTSVDLIVTNAIQKSFGGGMWDAYGAKLSPPGNNMLFASYFGGSGNDQGIAISIDNQGAFLIAGASASTNFPIQKAFQDYNRGGNYDAFIVKCVVEPAPAGIVSAGPNIDLRKPQTPGNLSSPATNIASTVAGVSNVNHDPHITELLPNSPNVINLTPSPEQKAVKNATINVPPPADYQPTPEPSSKTIDTAPAAPQTDRSTTIAVPPPADHQPSVDVPSPVAQTDPAKTGDSAVTNAASASVKEAIHALEASIQTQPLINADAAKTNLAAQAKISPELTALLMASPLIGSNLVVNGGAEDGEAAASLYKPVVIPGWTTTNKPNVLAYGVLGGFPSTNHPGPINRGQNFIVGGPDNQIAELSQLISLAAVSNLVQNGQLRYEFSAYLGGAGGQQDFAIGQAIFLNASSNIVGQANIGPVKMADRKYTTALVQRTAQGLIPATAQSILIQIILSRVDGSYNDAVVDDVSFIFLKPE